MLNARQKDIAEFVNFLGGGLIALTEASAESPGGGRNAYGWLPVCLDDQDFDHHDVCPASDLTLIPGHTANCGNMTRPPLMAPYHTIFTGPSGFSGLSVLAVDNDAPIEEQDVIIVGQLDFVSEFDCNANGTPDECDIDDCCPEDPACADCNRNEIPDECDIASGVSQDGDGNGVPDECDCGPCPTDVDASGNTGPFDLAFLLGFWGPVGPNTVCLDADEDGIIGPFDLAVLLGAWGPCPP